MVSYKRKRSSYISKRNSSKRNSSKRKSSKRKSSKRKSSKRKSSKRKSFKRKSIKRKSATGRKSRIKRNIKKSRSNDLNEEMQKFALLAYLSGPDNQKNIYSWNPKVLSTKNVRIVTDQWGTDDEGKTYYYDAVVKAKSMNDVSSWIKNHKNFDYIKELKLSKNQ